MIRETLDTLTQSFTLYFFLAFAVMILQYAIYITSR